MGEPLYFVPGSEKLFKFFLREILAILCTREAVSEERNAGIVGGGRLPTLGEGCGIGAMSNHMTSLA